MPIKRYSVLLALLVTLFSNVNFSKAQCSITSGNGWTATFNIIPTAVVPEFSACPNYYHYEIRYNYTVTFSGSGSNRSISANAYFTCSGGTGGDIYQSLGTFTGNASGTLTTSNSARQYTSPYGSNPTCSTITLANVNCTSVRLDYWGNGVPNGSIICPLTTAPMPIELLSFNAIADQDKVDLKWTTASEINNDYFTLEKSRDGINFAEALRLKGAGNSTQIINYSETDHTPYSGISYYRLKQTDYNGDFSYSQMVAVETNRDDVISTIYPNPSDGPAINIYVSSASTAVVEVNIFNPIGQLVSHLQLQPDEKGIVNQQIELPESGSLFFVSFSQNNKATGYHKVCVTRN